MIVITKDKIVECESIELEGSTIQAYTDRGRDEGFTALDAPNEAYAKTTFEWIQKEITEGNILIDLTDEEIKRVPEDVSTAAINPVSVFEAIEIARLKKPMGLFITSEMVEGETHFTGIDNSTGRAYIANFDDKSKCVSWLRGEFEIE